VVLVACLLTAVTAPVAWSLTRPPAAVGAPVDAAPPAAPTGAATASPAPPAPPPASAPATPAGPPLPPMTARPATPAPPPRGPAPVRLRIPSLGVDAPVVPTGVTASGDVAVPERGAEVGWYAPGARPGAPEGSAVLVGHVDTASQGPGALSRLRRADVGAEVLVELADGSRLRYAVAGRDLVPKPDLPRDALFAARGAPQLVLVSCGGPFDATTRRYRDNVVVVARPAA
jgi:sortase (surface protein transpeptidase)